MITDTDTAYLFTSMAIRNNEAQTDGMILYGGYEGHQNKRPWPDIRHWAAEVIYEVYQSWQTVSFPTGSQYLHIQNTNLTPRISGLYLETAHRRFKAFIN
jgi:hypothetical protein